MKMTSRTWSRGFTLSLVVGTVLACTGSIREDVFLCENAVSHLQQCCPGFNASIACNYDPGCLGTTYPDLDSTQSNCILAEPCDILRQNGVCESAGELPSTAHGDAPSPSVCTQPPSSFDAGPTSPSPVGVACTSASDCTVPGEACCLAFTSQSINRICTPSPCFEQACLSTSECGPGMVCGVSGDIASVCVPGDASTPIPDAQATAPDATDAQSKEDAASDGSFTRSDADAMRDAPSDGEALSDAAVDAVGE